MKKLKGTQGNHTSYEALDEFVSLIGLQNHSCTKLSPETQRKVDALKARKAQLKQSV